MLAGGLKRRKGVQGYVIVAFIFGLLIMELIVAGFYVSKIVEDGETKLSNNERKNVLAEKLLEAPCATESRGVFYESSIEAGDFVCIGRSRAVDRINVRFRYGDEEGTEEHTWSLLDEGIAFEDPNFGILVIQPRSEPVLDEQYEVLVMNSSTGETFGGTMWVGVQ